MGEFINETVLLSFARSSPKPRKDNNSCLPWKIASRVPQICVVGESCGFVGDFPFTRRRARWKKGGGEGNPPRDYWLWLASLVDWFMAAARGGSGL